MCAKPVDHVSRFQSWIVSFHLTCLYVLIKRYYFNSFDKFISLVHQYLKFYFILFYFSNWNMGKRFQFLKSSSAAGGSVRYRLVYRRSLFPAEV